MDQYTLRLMVLGIAKGINPQLARIKDLKDLDGREIVISMGRGWLTAELSDAEMASMSDMPPAGWVKCPHGCRDGRLCSICNPN